MRTSLLALTVTLTTPALAADFEGALDARMTMASPREEERGSGTIRMWVARAGTRMEMKMTSPMGEMQMTSMHLRARPGESFLLNDEKKLYVEMPRGDSERGDDAGADRAKVRKLAPEKVAGHECAHAVITDADGDETEIWTSKALGSAEDFWAAMAGEARDGKKDRASARKLREAGADGWPLKFVSRQKDGQVVTWEVTRVEKRSVPAALLSLDGYKKSDPGAATMGQFKPSPEAKKRMDDQRRQFEESMKRLSPEQKRQMEQMMRDMPQGADASDEPDGGPGDDQD